MKVVAGEKLLEIIVTRRKGNKTPFELGIGYETDSRGSATGRVRIRTEQIESGIAPLVASVSTDEACRLLTSLQDALDLIRKQC